MSMFKHRYRIVRDSFSGYEAQIKRWYWPFWSQSFHGHFVNTHSTVEKAEDFIRNGGTVKEVKL